MRQRQEAEKQQKSLEEEKAVSSITKKNRVPGNNEIQSLSSLETIS